ncbi:MULTISPECIES: glycoside hydrolase family 108 protein [Bradyrhizobium]|uniref:glycoside hydrolase family 108 protein n=1 Tax=Bradyrhizobium TaxID=374 RepID=UPI0009ECCB98|nr:MULTISPECIES: glycosyl hydrolase 108 family protein [Bradyrhizobium]
MAVANFAKCLAVTLTHEGGYSNNPSDRGNWTGGRVGIGLLKGTRYGIAAHAYPYLDIKNLTLGDARAIYERDYWKPVRGESLPYGVDLATFDAGVLSGCRRSMLWLQAAVGAKEDGAVGHETISKVLAANRETTIRAICEKRRSFLRRLPSWKFFSNGWSRRIADVEAKALAM